MVIHGCNSQPKETPQDRLQKQLWEQEQARKTEQRNEEAQLRAQSQKILSELPAYQEMKKREEEEKARVEAERMQSSSSSYSELEDRVAELEEENEKLKSKE
ncbi:hypothetical protein [Pedobacter gandavensis]|uniref:Uncharacterized protein n=1 Tax=Pedobacter gandavensis TaxID=2679963 RepID=A0ABR6F2I0_9SPHI|nr:hypothetical protein [Pedobacter gandavensis]MBB2151716.1 hypothetical protein [Pedobacter gandavensis]